MGIDGFPAYNDRAWFDMNRFFGSAEEVPKTVIIDQLQPKLVSGVVRVENLSRPLESAK